MLFRSSNILNHRIIAASFVNKGSIRKAIRNDGFFVFIYVNLIMSRIYSDDKGQFEYQSVGMTNSFELFFIKEGFKTKKVENHISDTILLEPIQ